ncbi:MAG: TolC family protein [Deltaproteobacteria bacterium]|nr:TolC family protein [Deltaproteobacteria bacterium]
MTIYRQHLNRVVKALIIAIVGLTVTCWPAESGTSAAELPSLTLDDAINLALSQSPLIKSGQAAVTRAEAAETQAKSGFFPRVDLSESFQRTNNPMWTFGTKLNQESIKSADFEPDRLNHPDPVSNFATNLSLRQSIFDRGQSWYGLKQAELGLDASKKGMGKTRQEIIYQTINSYYQLVMAEQTRKIAQEALISANKHLALAESKLKSGLAVKSDVLRASVHLASLEQEELTAENRVKLAQSWLSKVLGVDSSNAINTSSSFDTRPAAPQNINESMAKALAARPDYLQLKLMEQATAKGLEKARADNLPDVSLVGQYELDTDNFDRGGQNYTIAATVSLNLFSGFYQQGKLAEAKANLMDIQAKRRDLELAIGHQVKSAALNLQAAYKRHEVAVRAVDQAKENLEIAGSRYQAGLITLIDLLDAELAYNRSQSNLLNAGYDVSLAKADQSFAAGGLGNDR